MATSRFTPVLGEFRMRFTRAAPAPRPRLPPSACHALQRVPSVLGPNCQASETVCAQRQLMETGSWKPRLSAFTRSSHMQLPKRRAHDYALPVSHSRGAPTASLLRAPPCSAAASHTRARSTASSHSRACRLAPTARVRHYIQVASEPAAIQLPAHTRAAADCHATSCTAEGGWGAVHESVGG